MPSDRSLLALHDIRENVGFAREFVEAMTFEQFAGDRRTVYAVARCIEIVSEAARALTADLRERHPTLPWRAIMDLGNVYRHGCRSVVAERMWRTVQDGLPQFAAVVELEIVYAQSGPKPTGEDGTAP